ncbi:hypothetical protein PLICRDRAFT_152811 [Plicaturopsis crispa FD-325 SS-3]|nr:hypothetical protein PLICRDRAFT_152811 [Plicaturopsis crispa FD-325 SS-3]
MADYESVRQRIIASVFSKRNAAGEYDESYVAHVKIWEDAGTEGGGNKPRYILLSQTSNGMGFIHKSKLNTNGTFSVGKTWRLPELRAISVENPLSFSITLARTYKWQTESQRDQSKFLIAIIRLFRNVTGGSAALQLEGIADPDSAPAGRQQNDYARVPARTPSPSANGGVTQTPPRRSPLNPRTQTPVQNERLPPRQPSPAAQSRTGGLPSRPSSPANSTVSRGYAPAARSTQSSRSRPPSPSTSVASQPSTVRPRQGRRPSNAASTSSQVPSITLPMSPTSPARPSVTSQSSWSSNTNARASNATTESRRTESTASRPSLDVPSTAPTSLQAPSPLSAYSAGPLTPRGNTPSPEPTSRSRKQSADDRQARRDHNARVSFFDPPNQTSLDRLIAGHGGPEGDGDGGGEGDGEETAQATMASVEEMLEGYEWASEDVMGRKTARGTADLIEARLLDELMALEKANIHSFLESDDRIEVVLKYMDQAVAELDNMDSLVSSYKIHLNAVSDDISYIQSQNRGLQVQTQNQRALLGELENLLQTVHVDRDALVTLTQESLEKQSSITRLEEAATELYKALQAGRDTDMAATMERLDEYRTHNAQFCKRIFDFLSIMFTAQASMLLGDTDGIVRRGRPALIDHQDMETYLGRYGGLMLYLKEMDETVYAKLCAAYFSAASELHSKQMRALLSIYSGFVKKASEDDQESFSATPNAASSKAGSGMRRAGTIIRSPMDGRSRDKDNKERNGDGELRASEAFGQVLEQIAPLIYREDDFIADFLQINDAALTFADYAGLENYFRRQATRAAGLSPGTMKLVRGAMDLIFGFLPAELKNWLDSALAKDSLQIIGIIAILERFLVDADERGNAFLQHALEKQLMRLKGLFDRHITEQIKGVEDTKLTSKKRKGVAHFIKYFPIYVGRVENQLLGANGLEIRANVDMAYERIVQTMFDSLKQMAKMDGEGEDKGQLNYHVILIENAHYFVAEIGLLEIGSVAAFLKRAESIYEENLSAYVKLVLRRPFSKIIDYFEGVERLLKTTAPTEVASNSSYNRSALKKVVKEYNAKDIRKHIDALFKRVEKHFTEASEKATTVEESVGIAPGTVLVGVWKACEDELLRVREVFAKRIVQCYKDSGVALEFTAGDVEAAFRRHRVGS